MELDEAAMRLETLARIKKEGVDPYPAIARRSHTIGGLLDGFSKLEKNGSSLTIVGRLRSLRRHGGMSFAHLEDRSGRIQIAWKKDTVGASAYAWVGENIHVGDFLEITGLLFTTKVGEKTLDARTTRLLTKSLEPLPEKWHGLTDVEVRFRKRYLDLIANPEVGATFRTRAAIVKALRGFLDERGYLEVETPILQPIPGGATARPFVTHHNALDIDLYLRIAPELYLKRLVVGGLERVYEISRCFRNEGVDHTHSPEFTQIEWYEAYADYHALMAQIEELLPRIVQACGLDIAAVPYGKFSIDFTAPYERMTFRDALKKYGKLDIEEYESRDKLAKKAVSLGVTVHAEDGKDKILDELFKTFVRPRITNPMFIIDHPVELSPLSKRKPDSPQYVERFQLLVGGGSELINGFSELNDPLDQESRFREQEQAREAGDVEAQRFDADYIEALKIGLPPTAGLGMGIDRLTMLLTNNHNIKEVILFPTLRPQS